MDDAERARLVAAGLLKPKERPAPKVRPPCARCGRTDYVRFRLRSGKPVCRACAKGRT